jgi:hypothetical protein
MAQRRHLTDSETQEVLALTRKDINMTLLKRYFAAINDAPAPRFHTNDIMTLPAGKLYNKTAVETTIGRYIFEMFVLPTKYLMKYGYINTPFTGDVLEGTENKLANMLLNDEITVQDYASYLDNGEWISMGQAYYITPSLSFDFMQPLPDVIAKKNELFKQYDKELSSGDTNVASKVENELLDMAKKELKAKGDPSMDFYNQGGEFKFPVAYKKTSIMGGIVDDINKGGVDVLKSNYIDGITKEDFAKFANLTVDGGYARGVKTQEDGYMTKKYNNAMQTVVLDEKGSDCHTHQTLQVTIYPELKTMFLYRYIVEGGKYKLLDDSNIDQYVGKVVSLRSPMLCTGDKICNICAGELYYKMGIENIGLLSNTASGNLMNLSMKKVHDSTVKFIKIDASKYITQLS